ncbi:metalloregulator ArsR/SmtB family transcription factor [uncultured Flavobacterium sp.]|uniref:ArsR/SmtB family transcription factor n=1 Tax=uncultured Flavobacterium sp. TaxID=165435 RepID=UPI003081657D
MGITKHLNFDLETKAIGKICKALGHPTRIEIMTLLWKRNNRTCGEIVELIPLAQSTISKHLLELKKANLVAIENVGKKTIYSVEVENIQMLKKYLSSYLSTIEIPEQSKSTVSATRHKLIGRKNYLKQHNYEFPDRRVKLAL